MAYGIERVKKRLGGIPEKGKGEYGIRKMKERELRGKSVVSVKKLAGNYRPQEVHKRREGASDSLKRRPIQPH